MIIFTEHITPRLTYILNYIFKIKFELPYELTKDAEKFVKSNDIKINYSNNLFENAYHIIPEGILFEREIRSELPVLSYINKLPVVYAQDNGDIKFDILSALFWFLSRYEEYMPFEPDGHGRFSATQSFAYKNSILDRPIVDEWISYFREELKVLFPKTVFKGSWFKSTVTVDVDSPWCYKNKGFVRNLVGAIRDLLQFNLQNILLRYNVLSNITTDPWYVFKWLLSLYADTKHRLVFFIHVGDYGKFDKTVNYKSKAFGNFIHTIDSSADIAIHPSYRASQNRVVFKEELIRLSNLVGKKIVKSRQHFLLLTMPSYYNMLIELGIEEDYSMGFADKSGFRAGTSGSFNFFNLEHNIETSLLIHPFVVMDRTLNSYEGNTPEEAIVTINKLIDRVTEVDGTFVCLWHNESLGNTSEWKDWLKVFSELFTRLNSSSVGR